MNKIVDIQDVIDLLLINREEEYKKSISAEAKHKSVIRSKHDAHVAFCDYLIECVKQLPSVQKDLITKIQNGIKVTNADDVYSCGMRNGMRWCVSLIDDKEPLYENCPPVQPRTGKWIEASEDWRNQITWWQCSECGTPSSIKSNFCPNCGADMRPQFEEPEINPCRGCEDYDGEGGCKTKGGCADKRGEEK